MKIIILGQVDKQRFLSKTRRADVLRPGMTTPCLEWTAATDRHGYGRLSNRRGRAGNPESAHRVAWENANGAIPNGLHVLHRCDNPLCVSVEHLFIGTAADNVKDCMEKGRFSPPPRLTGANHPSRLHPECLPRGNSHWSRLHPEWITRGDLHWSRLQPERVLRGEGNGMSKLTDAKVQSIFRLHGQGWTGKRIANKFGVSNVTIGMVLSRKIWKHVPVMMEVQS